MADPTPAAPAPSGPQFVDLIDKSGQPIKVLESERMDYLAQGYDDPQFAEGAGPQLDGLGENVLARAEAVDRGATFGLGGFLGSVGAGAVSELSGYDGPRMAAPGLDAAVEEKSDFRLGFEDAEAARRQRAEALGLEGMAWEMGGGLAAGLATGGTSMAAKGLAMAPGAIAEQLGGRMAARVLGQDAVAAAARGVAGEVAQAAIPGLGRVVAQRAIQGATEAAIGGGAQTLLENATVVLDNPWEVAQDVALGAAGGLVLGGALGSTFGLAEGAARATGGLAKNIEAAITKKTLPGMADVTPESVVAEAATRPMHAAEIPDPARSLSRRVFDEHMAVTGGLDETLANGTRSARENLDAIENIREELRKEAGIAAKQMLNEDSIRTRLANDLTEEVDGDDLARLDDIRGRHAEATTRAAGSDSVLAEVQKSLQLAQDSERAAREALDAADVPAVRKAQRLVKGKVEEYERLARPDAKEIRPLREALKNAQREAADAAKRLASVESEAGSARSLAAQLDGELQAAPAPRRLTRLEVEARGMFDELSRSVDEMAKRTAGKDYDAVNQLRRQIDAHRQLAREAARRGDYGLVYESVDQGLKGAMGDFVNSTRSSAAEKFAKSAYNVPRSFLENRNVWGEVAERQLAANPNWSTAIAAGEDAHWKSLFGDIGEVGGDGWGVKRGAKSESVVSVLNSVGNPGTESMEEGIRRKLRADITDFASRSAAWGTPRARDLAVEAAKRAKQLEDTLDHVALVRRDAEAGAKRMKDGISLATMGAVGSAVTGNVAVGVPLVAARWLLSATSRYRGDGIQRMGKLAAKITRLQETGWRKASRFSQKGLGVRIGARERKEELAKERERELAEAKELLDIRSPKLAALAREGEATNAISPGLGDELVKTKIASAEFVVSKVPQSPSAALLSPLARHSTFSSATQLDRALAAVRDPKRTFERIADGAATAEDLDAMRKIYPAQYQRFVDGVVADLEKSPHARRTAEHKAYLARVTGLPLTPALLKISAAQARARAATQGAADAGKPQGQGNNGSDGETVRADMQMDPNKLATRSDQITSGG